MAHKLKLSLYVGEIDSFKRNIVNSDRPPGEDIVNMKLRHTKLKQVTHFQGSMEIKNPFLHFESFNHNGQKHVCTENGIFYFLL